VLLLVPGEALPQLRASINITTGTIGLPSGREVHVKLDGQPVVRLFSWGWPEAYRQPQDVRTALQEAAKPVQVLDVQPARRSSGYTVVGKYFITGILPPSGMRVLEVPVDAEGNTAAVQFATAEPVKKQPRPPQAAARSGGGSGSGRPLATMGDYLAAAAGGAAPAAMAVPAAAAPLAAPVQAVAMATAAAPVPEVIMEGPPEEDANMEEALAAPVQQAGPNQQQHQQQQLEQQQHNQQQQQQQHVGPDQQQQHQQGAPPPPPQQQLHEMAHQQLQGAQQPGHGAQQQQQQQQQQPAPHMQWLQPMGNQPAWQLGPAGQQQQHQPPPHLQHQQQQQMAILQVPGAQPHGQPPQPQQQQLQQQQPQSAGLHLSNSYAVLVDEGAWFSYVLGLAATLTGEQIPMSDSDLWGAFCSSSHAQGMAAEPPPTEAAAPPELVAWLREILRLPPAAVDPDADDGRDYGDP
jgi:hypothetical protein